MQPLKRQWLFLFVRNALRPGRRLAPTNKLPTLPQRFGGGSAYLSHTACLDRPRARTRNAPDESDLTNEQLGELFAGRFPASYPDEVIHLSKISKRDHQRIFDAFDPSKHEIDTRPPGWVLFDRRSSRTSIYLDTSDVHDGIVHSMVKSFGMAIFTKVSDDEDKFSFKTNSGELESHGLTTNKIPDFQISQYRQGLSRSTPCFIGEVGFSEPYPVLVDSVKNWLRRHPTRHIAFLIKLNEIPRFRGSKCLKALPDQVLSNADHHIGDMDSVGEKDSDGRLTFFGAPFVGKMTAFLEVWEKKGESNEIVLRRERINFYDSSKNLQPPEIALGFEELGISAEELQGEKVTINWKAWAHNLKGDSVDLAWERFQRVLKSHVAKGITKTKTTAEAGNTKKGSKGK